MRGSALLHNDPRKREGIFRLSILAPCMVRLRSRSRAAATAFSTASIRHTRLEQRGEADIRFTAMLCDSLPPDPGRE
jgi:hypothetical protein